MTQVLIITATQSAAESLQSALGEYGVYPTIAARCWQAPFTGYRYDVVVMPDIVGFSEAETAAIKAWRTERLPTLITSDGKIIETSSRQ